MTTPSINKPSPIAMILPMETEIESISVSDNKDVKDIGNDAKLESESDSEYEN